MDGTCAGCCLGGLKFGFMYEYGKQESGGDYKTGDNQNTIYTDPQRGGVRIKFKVNSTEFLDKTEEKKFLDLLENKIKSDSEEVYIDGYASTEGTADHNMALSRDRAETIQKVIKNNYPFLKIIIVANGEVKGDNAENRSVVINIVEKPLSYVWPVPEESGEFLDPFTPYKPWEPSYIKSNRNNSTEKYRKKKENIADNLDVRTLEDGLGDTQVQTFKLSGKTGKLAFDQVKNQYATDPSVLNNNKMATYYPLGDNYNKGKRLAVGDQMYIDIAGPLNGFVRFEKVFVGDNKFSIQGQTLDGGALDSLGDHPDAGIIRFEGEYNPRTKISTISITNITRAGNLASYFSGFSSLNLNAARGAQKLQWRTVIDNIEEFMTPGVEQLVRKEQIIITEHEKYSSVEKSTW
jgi:hypothetical protein